MVAARWLWWRTLRDSPRYGVGRRTAQASPRGRGAVALVENATRFSKLRGRAESAKGFAAWSRRVGSGGERCAVLHATGLGGERQRLRRVVTARWLWWRTLRDSPRYGVGRRTPQASPRRHGALALMENAARFSTLRGWAENAAGFSADKDTPYSPNLSASSSGASTQSAGYSPAATAR